MPGRYLEGGAAHLDGPGFRDWLAAKYDRLFNDYPEFDGIVLTLDETEYKLFRESDVQSSLSMPGRFTTMINTLDEVCAKYNKEYQRACEYFPLEIGLILINL